MQQRATAEKTSYTCGNACVGYLVPGEPLSSWAEELLDLPSLPLLPRHFEKVAFTAMSNDASLPVILHRRVAFHEATN